MLIFRAKKGLVLISMLFATLVTTTLSPTLLLHDHALIPRITIHPSVRPSIQISLSMTSDKDPSRGENQIEAKELKEVELSWQPKEKSRGELQRQTKKEEEDIIFIHAATTEESRRRSV